jgi:hypothetical protein
MKVNDFLNMVRKAVNSKTLYVMGGWGFPLTPANKERAFTNAYNKRPERKVKINAASNDTFAFDCCGLCKAVLWGWNADASKKNGGASYASNNVPDWDAKELMFKGCTEQSKDFTDIEAGEFLWLDGHCGIYLGDGLAAESTPKWKDGAQITAVANIGKKAGYESRTWTYHGHLKFVDYGEAPVPEKYPRTPFNAVNCLKGVSMRVTPYSDGEIVATVKTGASVIVEEVRGDYGKISGWAYLPSGFTWAEEMDGYKVGNEYKVLCDELNVRDKATTQGSTVLDVLQRGQVVQCGGITRDGYGNTWLFVSTYTGADKAVSGWIAAKYEGNVYVG